VAVSRARLPKVGLPAEGRVVYSELIDNIRLNTTEVVVTQSYTKKAQRSTEKHYIIKAL